MQLEPICLSPCRLTQLGVSSKGRCVYMVVLDMCVCVCVCVAFCHVMSVLWYSILLVDDIVDCVCSPG